MDIYFSADVETDGPIPGPYSMLSFALVYAGRFDGDRFEQPASYDQTFYAELRPIDDEALRVNGLDRERLLTEGRDPAEVMTTAADWVREVSGRDAPVLVAYPRLDLALLVLRSLRQGRFPLRPLAVFRHQDGVCREGSRPDRRVWPLAADGRAQRNARSHAPRAGRAASRCLRRLGHVGLNPGGQDGSSVTSSQSPSAAGSAASCAWHAARAVAYGMALVGATSVSKTGGCLPSAGDSSRLYR